MCCVAMLWWWCTAIRRYEKNGMTGKKKSDGILRTAVTFSDL